MVGKTVGKANSLPSSVILNFCTRFEARWSGKPAGRRVLKG